MDENIADGAPADRARARRRGGFDPTPEMVAMIEPEAALASAKGGAGRKPSLCWRRFAKPPPRPGRGCWRARCRSSWRASGSPTVRSSSIPAAPSSRYDKIHMFDVDLAGGESYRESATIGPAIARCSPNALGHARHDGLLRHALSESLPHAGPGRGDVHHGAVGIHAADRQAHWQVLLRARAIETGC